MYIFVGDESKCCFLSILMMFVSIEGIVSGLIIFVCLVDGVCLCFNVGLMVFIIDNFGFFMKGGGGMGDVV